MPGSCTEVHVCVQWDSLQALQSKLSQEQWPVGPILQHGRGAVSFKLEMGRTAAIVQADFNTVVRMDPDRVACTDPASGQVFWCQSTAVSPARGRHLQSLAAAVAGHLQSLQQQLTAANAQVGLERGVSGVP